MTANECLNNAELRSTPSSDVRQEIIFFTRTRKGGGAEVIVNRILAELDCNRFDIKVYYLLPIDVSVAPLGLGIKEFWLHSSENLMDEVDDTINDTECVDVMSQRQIAPKKSLLEILAGMYRRIIPVHFRQTARIWKLKSFLSSFMNMGRQIVGDGLKMLENRYRQLIKMLVLVFSTLDYEKYVSVCNFSIERDANQIEKILARYPNALPIAVMEEMAVRLWWAQRDQPRPYIVSLHAMESLYLPIMYQASCYQYEFEKKLFSQACQNAACATVPSEGCLRDMRDNFGVLQERLAIMPNFIDSSRIQKLACEEVTGFFPDIGSRKIFTQIARLDPVKNHELMLNACEILKQKRDDFVVLCIGDGYYRSEVESQIVQRGLKEVVYLLGEKENPFPYYRLADASLLTSHSESFALVLLESLAVGTLPISTDCPCGPREVLEDGRYGLLCPHNDSESFACAMSRVLDNDEKLKEVIDRRQEVIDRYDVNNVVPQWESIFKDLSYNGPQV